MPLMAAATDSSTYVNIAGLEMTQLGVWTLGVFVFLIVLSFVGFGRGVIRGQRKAMRRVRLLGTLIADLDGDNLPAQRQAALEHADRIRSHSDTVADAWHEFDESLVLSFDRKHLHNTVEADYFFDTETLAGELLHSRILSFLPSAMTALGVLGTFTGLVIGLWGLELGAEADSDQLRSGVSELIGGAAVAFATSVLGVLSSLIANFWNHEVARRVSAEVKNVQEAIDRLFTRHTVDRALIGIERSSADSNTALQELHEKIGYELQKAVTGLSQDMQAAVTAALESSIAPAMSKLTEKASKQSENILEGLVGKVASSLENIGDRQAESLTTAANSVTDSLGTMGDDFKIMMEKMATQMGSLMEGTAEQSEASQKRLEELMVAMSQQRVHTEEIVSRLAETVEAAGSTMKTSSHHLQTTARELEKVSEGFTDASVRISTQVESSTQLLDSSAEKLQQAVDGQAFVVEALRAQQDALSHIRAQMESTATSLEQSAQSALQGFSALEEHQKSYLTSLSHEFSQVTEHLTSKVASVNGHLTSQVEALEKSMQQWLDAYSASVSDHTQKRFEEWNTQSQGYAGHMLRIAQQLDAMLGDFADEKEHQKA